MSESLSLADTFKRYQPTIIERITQASFELSQEATLAVPIDLVRRVVADAMQRMHDDLAQGTTKHYSDIWLRLSAGQARAGISLTSSIAMIEATENAIIDTLAPLYPEAQALHAMISRIHQICAQGKNMLYVTFSETREQIIRTQNQAIHELSAPLIPIYPGILVLPLIGTFDSHRAATMIETLLDGIARQQAGVVLLDITGVPLVDQSVAHHIIQSAQAARLLGAEIVLVGIGPEIAQTFIQLGIDLSGIVTRSDLQAGFAYALQRFGLAVATAARGKARP